jgi:hypothetical protein
LSIPLTINGATFEYPENFDENWGVNATGWAQAVTNGMLQMSGGTFPITADVNFGPNFGLLSKYFETRSSNPATTGTVRLSSADAGIAWRNNANSGNLILTTNSSDQLLYNGSPIGGGVSSVSGTTNQITSTGGTTPILAIANPLTLPGAMTAGGNIAMASNKITGLANGTAASDAMAFGQKVYFQAVQGITTSGFTSTSATFVSTPLSVTITPSSASHRIKISAAFTVRSSGSASRWQYAIFNGTTQIAVLGEGGDIANPVEFPTTMLYIDSPATTSPITYTVQLRQEAGTSGFDFNPNTLTQIILAEEIV